MINLPRNGHILKGLNIEQKEVFTQVKSDKSVKCSFFVHSLKKMKN